MNGGFLVQFSLSTEGCLSLTHHGLRKKKNIPHRQLKGARILAAVMHSQAWTVKSMLEMGNER